MPECQNNHAHDHAHECHCQPDAQPAQSFPPIPIMDQPERCEHWGCFDFAPAAHMLNVITSTGREQRWCPTCATFAREVCPTCNRATTLLITSHLPDDDGGETELCRACVDGEDLRICECCDEAFPSDDMTAVEGGNDQVCSDCLDSHYSRCDDCHDYFRNLTNIGGNDVCESCAENYEQCTECGGWFDVNSRAWQNGSGGRCQSCDESYCDESDDDDRESDGCTIEDASTRIRSCPIGSGPVYYGVELEIGAGGNRYGAAENVGSLLGDVGTWGDFILKADGSVSDGFEIVSRPADLAWHREHWAPILSPQVCRREGINSFRHPKTGMHVHVSRAPLSELQIAKIALFLNLRRNASLISAIAGRSVESTHYAKSKCLNDPVKLKDAWQSDRYEPLNLQNDATIEFRIFKGTLSAEGFHKNLEFAAALTSYCAPASRSLSDSLSDTKFLTWIAGERKVYPSLTKWLERRNYIPAPKVKRPESAPILTAED